MITVKASHKLFTYAEARGLIRRVPNARCQWCGESAKRLQHKGVYPTTEAIASCKYLSLLHVAVKARQFSWQAGCTLLTAGANEFAPRCVIELANSI